ncbi:acetylcholine receptor subunit beta-like 2 isoform X2 [Mercenaria mercenaria]|uniref:acetylcholine receptor subunit beta-like 2 isoform X2 n=1 Tax=Mercenaria mercenaria TaxID=6596 RepID=UPI00234F0D2D|nr:acetylcholine receptor subunit beta-like 2 isoform X2 [Mercenaria mercenaria]
MDRRKTSMESYTENDDLKHIFVKPENIWKPELMVDNALQDIDIISSDELHLRVRYDGTVDWEPPMLFVTHCEVDITYYPYDTQRCAVELLSWSYTIDEVILDHLFEEVSLEDFKEHGEWHMLYTEIDDKNLTEHLPDGTLRVYPQINFRVILERRAGFYNLNVMMPITVTSLMVVLVFIVPLHSGEKISYILTEFLALLVLLTIVVPPTSITVSILGIYLGVVLILAALGILVTVLIMYLFHKEGAPKKDSLIMTMTICLARMLCWNTSCVKSAGEETPTMRFSMGSYNFEDAGYINGNLENFSNDTKDGTKVVNKIKSERDENEITWKFVATVFDRFCFYLFLISTILMNLSFVFALSEGGKSPKH